MSEIEVKVIEINRPEIVKRIEKLGAEKTFDGEVKSIIFDFEDKHLASKKQMLRLRKKGEKSFLTHKYGSKNTRAKINEEEECGVEDFEKIKKILLGIGLKIEKGYNKRRVSYKLKDVLFEIDEYEGIPPYMEIEAPSEDEIKKYIDILDIPDNKVKTWNGKELLQHYGVKE